LYALFVLVIFATSAWGVAPFLLPAFGGARSTASFLLASGLFTRRDDALPFKQVARGMTRRCVVFLVSQKFPRFSHFGVPCQFLSSG
jgi:hypothetical protein